MERTYNIPLRKEFSKVPRYKKSSKSIRAIKEFISKHMKADEVVIGKYLNQEVWKNGPKNPPSKVSVKAVKEENKVKVELVDAPEEPVKEEPQKKKVKEEVKEELEEELEGSMNKKTAEKVAEEIVEQTKEITKNVPKTPSARELKEKKETKEKQVKVKKVPTTKELKEKN